MPGKKIAPLEGESREQRQRRLAKRVEQLIARHSPEVQKRIKQALHTFLFQTWKVDQEALVAYILRERGIVRIIAALTARYPNVRRAAQKRERHKRARKLGLSVVPGRKPTVH